MSRSRPPPAESPRSTVLKDRKPTINDIARLASVSKKTVSRVINQSPFVKEETRVRVDEIMRRVGYTPDPQARGLAFRRSFLIGLIYDNPNAQYVVNIQEGVLDAHPPLGLRAGGASLRPHRRRTSSPRCASSSAARSSMA